MNNLLIEKFQLNQMQLDKFAEYYNLLVSYNQKINLTAIIEYEDVYIKHFYDSLMMTKYIDVKGKNICDVGSGAGFPAIPLAILNESVQITIIEPTFKRVNFLNLVIEKLSLKNVKIINDRAENAVKEYREKFDIVCARAVANLPILLELCIPLAKVKGFFIALKGANYQLEMAESQKAEQILGVKPQVYCYELPNEKGTRSILMYRKSHITSTQYPRKYSQIKKDPL